MLGTKLINWNEYTFFSWIHESIYPTMQTVIEEKRKMNPEIKIFWDETLAYTKSREECAKIEIGKFVFF